MLFLIIFLSIVCFFILLNKYFHLVLLYWISQIPSLPASHGIFFSVFNFLTPLLAAPWQTVPFLRLIVRMQCSLFLKLLSESSSQKLYGSLVLMPPFDMFNCHTTSIGEVLIAKRIWFLWKIFENSGLCLQKLQISLYFLSSRIYVLQSYGLFFSWIF